MQGSVCDAVAQHYITTNFAVQAGSNELVTEPTLTSSLGPSHSSQSTMATTPTTQVVEEGKLLSENLSTVKLQAAQMRRHLVRMPTFGSDESLTYRRSFTGQRRYHGRTEECQLNAC